MPEIVDRCVEAVLEDNPDMDESRAWAICTAQHEAEADRVPEPTALADAPMLSREALDGLCEEHDGWLRFEGPGTVVWLGRQTGNAVYTTVEQAPEDFDEYLFEDPEEAEAAADGLGCSGHHEHGDQFMPCETHDAFLEHFEDVVEPEASVEIQLTDLEQELSNEHDFNRHIAYAFFERPTEELLEMEPDYQFVTFNHAGLYFPYNAAIFEATGGSISIPQRSSDTYRPENAVYVPLPLELKADGDEGDINPSELEAEYAGSYASKIDPIYVVLRDHGVLEDDLDIQVADDLYAALAEYHADLDEELNVVLPDFAVEQQGELAQQEVSVDAVALEFPPGGEVIDHEDGDWTAFLDELATHGDVFQVYSGLKVHPQDDLESHDAPTYVSLDADKDVSDLEAVLADHPAVHYKIGAMTVDESDRPDEWDPVGSEFYHGLVETEQQALDATELPPYETREW